MNRVLILAEWHRACGTLRAAEVLIRVQDDDARSPTNPTLLARMGSERVQALPPEQPRRCSFKMGTGSGKT